MQELRLACIDYGFAYGDEKSEWDIERLDEIICAANNIMQIIIPALKKSGVNISEWEEETERQINEERKHRKW